MSGGENLVQVLQRWEHHGAQWRLVGIQNGHAAVDLCTCYGEPVDRLLLPAATTTSRSPCACHRRGLCLVEAERRQAVRGVVPGGLSLQRKRPGLLAHLRALRQGRQAVRLHTYFQAQQALANSGKRLPTNAEWQAAVAGTPDSSACNVTTFSVQNTGANSGCVSRFGAFDMVGNVDEWVADWGDQADKFNCPNKWPSGYGLDASCFGLGEGEANSHLPGALVRGGDYFGGSNAGPFAVDAEFNPSDSAAFTGFRGAR